MSWSSQGHFRTQGHEPLNAPELTSNEKYLAIMKQALRKHPTEANSEEDMKKLAFLVSVQKKLQDVVQNLMSGVKRKVRAYSYGFEVEWTMPKAY